GDIIKIQGTKETYDPARLDKIVVTAPEPVIPDGVTAVYSGGTAVISSDTAYDSAAVIFAAYDSGGRLTDVCAAKAEIGIGSTEVSADDEFISSASDADDVRVFLWDSLDKMMPL
ncbi:MAG: hypothetical protein LUD03_04075, partial [Firmicutes bacterium]|nr:hypothetical protein [Bacillota bacterium]